MSRSRYQDQLRSFSQHFREGKQQGKTSWLTVMLWLVMVFCMVMALRAFQLLHSGEASQIASWYELDELLALLLLAALGTAAYIKGSLRRIDVLVCSAVALMGCIAIAKLYLLK